MESTTDAFRRQFEQEPQVIARAPGRVNLIGEHTDYNQGFVLPVAIDKEILIAAAPLSEPVVEIYSVDYQTTDKFSLDSITSNADQQWANYTRGMLHTLQAAGYQLSGFRAAISGNVPQGAGLSSSAALEVAMCKLAAAMNKLSINGKEIAVLAQRAENQFIGVNCGIMDQFVSSLAKPDCALLIDCRSLESRDVPLRLAQHGLSIVITNSGVRRGLVESEYNARREECTAGAAMLAKRLSRPVASLRDVTLAELRTFEHELPPVLVKRCHHVVSENDRVERAAAALASDDFSELGQLMNQSHQSLRDDFDVSCRELDMLVELTQKHTKVLGARMTGAGFGGCTVAIMENAALESFKTTVVSKYEMETGRKSEVYVCSAVGGANIITPVQARQ